MPEYDGIDAYLMALTPEQAENVRAIRSLILRHAPSLSETLDEGKWFGGLLTYALPAGTFVYALGPRAGNQTTFHMMPFYGSARLKEKHGTALKEFLSGKSCIKFKRYADLPEAALIDIIENGTKGMAAMMESKARRTPPIALNPTE